jgi:hypothetical protein
LRLPLVPAFDRVELRSPPVHCPVRCGLWRRTRIVSGHRCASRSRGIGGRAAASTASATRSTTRAWRSSYWMSVTGGASTADLTLAACAQFRLGMRKTGTGSVRGGPTATAAALVLDDVACPDGSDTDVHERGNFEPRGASGRSAPAPRREGRTTLTNSPRRPRSSRSCRVRVPSANACSTPEAASIRCAAAVTVERVRPCHGRMSCEYSEGEARPSIGS